MKTIRKFFDNLKNMATKRAKAPLLRELDRAIEKAESGATGMEIVHELKSAILRCLSGKLGPVVLDILLASVDWHRLARSSGADLAAELRWLRVRIEGARL